MGIPQGLSVATENQSRKLQEHWVIVPFQCLAYAWAPKVLVWEKSGTGGRAGGECLWVIGPLRPLSRRGRGLSKPLALP